MNCTLALNNNDEIALFYDSALSFIPKWASIDIEVGQVCIGGENDLLQVISLDQSNKHIYNRVELNTELLLIRVNQDKKRTPQETFRIPLSVSREL
ncbi:MAG: hypothetical protein CMH27_10975 [Micavibrio sp.]|nr:hypothetical protein [Micavibrio sp.]|tara:strand:+ start:521 stop:808 length:288 start_codon:yes stop_codon:yes gene_type:complete